MLNFYIAKNQEGIAQRERDIAQEGHRNRKPLYSKPERSYKLSLGWGNTMRIPSATCTTGEYIEGKSQV